MPKPLASVPCSVAAKPNAAERPRFAELVVVRSNVSSPAQLSVRAGARKANSYQFKADGTLKRRDGSITVLREGHTILIEGTASRY
jgi:hypothetical protein